jgi:hypothetical protein
VVKSNAVIINLSPLLMKRNENKKHKMIEMNDDHIKSEPFAVRIK